MKKWTLYALAAVTFCTAAVHAQEVAGTWQGTLKVPNKELRIVIKVTKADGALKTTMYSIDQGGQAFTAATTTLQDGALRFTLPVIGAAYQGKLSPDGAMLTGTWTQGDSGFPLVLKHVTPETAWVIPEPPAPTKSMAPDADPSFDVATIKPNNSGAPNMQGLTIRGRNFATRNSSLADLLSFAYELQAKQVVGGPDWIDKDRYDIAAVPDVEGAPNIQQLRVMIRKLLVQRFQLKFHNEKRDLSAFFLTVDKGGSKLTPTQMSGPLPGIGMQPSPGGLTLIVRNGTLTDFTSFLQLAVLDRPVVDDTGLKGKFDLNVKFLPNESEFNGHPPPMPKQADDVEAAPGLFEAIQQQLGLKLEAKKAPVTVMVIDHVEKPSAN